MDAESKRAAQRLRQAKYREANRHRLREAGRVYREQNADAVRQSKAKWTAENREKAREMTRLAQANRRAQDPDACRAINRVCEAERRARMLNRVPPWLSEEERSEIAEFYRNCPRGMEVDHIFPLNGSEVSGLHVRANLQYLSRAENRRKGNAIPRDGDAIPFPSEAA